MRAPPVLLVALALPFVMGQATLNGVPQPVPVTTVNGLRGDVVVPLYQRQTSGAMTVSMTDGTATWVFPAAFTNMPTCYYGLATTATGYTFDYPQVSAISTTAVTLKVSARQSTVTITSLALPVALQLTSAGAPAGTSVNFSCLAPL